MQKIVLASASPRRSRLLAELGIDFDTVPSRFVEPPFDGSRTPAEHVQSNARGKVACLAPRYGGRLIIGADTVVVCRGKILGKPATLDEAFEYLSLLNGDTHAVYTGVALAAPHGGIMTGHEKTHVRFRKITPDEMHAYLACINPLDKAGAYAIQGPGALIVREIRGCYYNVVGFPLARIETMLLRMGLSLFSRMRNSSG